MIIWDAPGVLDRADHHRGSSSWVAGLWRAEGARLLKFLADGRFTTNEAGDALTLVTPFVEFDDQRHILLGLIDDLPVFAVETVVDGPLHTLREVGHKLSSQELEIASLATALTNWHRSEPRCPRCGEPSKMINGGFARLCVADNEQLFPRTDPAVIVAIVDDQDRLLLGGQSSWGEGRVSVLAGFVEAGESLEQAVHREIGEESDIALGEVRYFGSQPWPMPRSLMVAFAARAKTTDICVDGTEIVFADWFTRERVRAEVAAGTLKLPTSASIASRLVNAWLDGTLPI